MISVIIPTYKPTEYLFECLDSLKKQDTGLNSFEIIIVLNGEKEPYYASINNYIIQNNLFNTKLTYTEIQGVSSARNLALDISRGDFIVFIDDDDWVSSNYLSGLLLRCNKDSVAVSNEKTFIDEKNIGEGYISKAYKKFIQDKESEKSLFRRRKFLSSACFKMIPRNIILDDRFNGNFSVGEDALFMAIISNKIKSINLATEDVIYYRRLRCGSASRKRQKFSQRIKNAFKLFKSYLFIYLSKPLSYNLLFFLSRFVAVFKVILKK